MAQGKRVGRAAKTVWAEGRNGPVLPMPKQELPRSRSGPLGPLERPVAQASPEKQAAGAARSTKTHATEEPKARTPPMGSIQAPEPGLECALFRWTETRDLKWTTSRNAPSAFRKGQSWMQWDPHWLRLGFPDRAVQNSPPSRPRVCRALRSGIGCDNTCNGDVSAAAPPTQPGPDRKSPATSRHRRAWAAWCAAARAACRRHIAGVEPPEKP